MSDEMGVPAPKLAEHYRAIPGVDLVRFFQAVAPDDICPVCKGQEWAFGDPGRQIAAIGLTEDVVPIVQRMAMEAVWVRCKVCGFLRLHERGHIEDWLAKHSDDVAS